MRRPAAKTAVVVGLWIAAVSTTRAQDATASEGRPAPKTPAFERPAQIRSGTAPLGHDRVYPSPVFHDLDGDGVLDIVLGDLPGNVTVTKRTAEGDPTALGKTVPVPAADGKPLDFENW